MNSIKDLKPTAIWQNFYKLTQVPRPSNHEEQARKFMLEWAKENNIEADRRGGEYYYEKTGHSGYGKPQGSDSSGPPGYGTSKK